MGFDVYGLSPKSEKGKYFRNSVWWWKPLARFILENCDVPEEEAEDWGTNDGQEVSALTADHIADLDTFFVIVIIYCRLYNPRQS
jgi:hypothetical protein